MSKRKIALGLLGVLLAAYAVVRVYLAVAIRSELNALREMGYPTTAAELNAWYVTPPEGQNAADEYLLAFEAFTDEGIETDLLPTSGVSPELSLDGPLPEEVLAEIGRYLEVNAVALEHLHRAAQMPDCRWSWNFERPPMLDPEQADSWLELGQGIRNSARMLMEEALYYRDTGDTRAALRSVEDILAAGKALAEHPVLMSYFMAASINKIAVDTLHNLMATTELTDAQLVEIQQTFREAQRRLALAPTILKDALEFKPSLDVLLEDIPALLRNSPDDFDLEDLPEAFTSLVSFLIYRYSGLADSNYLHILRGARHYIALCALPRHEAIERAHETFPHSGWGSVLESTEALIDMQFVVLGTVFRAPAHNDARFLVTETALAVERYRLEYGRLPERLEELVPAYLETVPLDPFDGEPLRYQREEKGFTVYSIGSNTIDEGGRGSPNHDGEDDDIAFSVLRQ